ncbi:MAG: hypothetical protein CMI27_06775 [Opitutae bacterium]|nr:hypothetical protein [Opitutae bacterium]|tara:strand:+ start:153 stop:539 length:387 start_codon:yes stop_codon:yes gene_type:complete
MKVLVDTFPFVWLCTEPSRLSREAREVLADEKNEFFFSDASVLELSLKYNDGSLEMPMNPRRWVKEQVKIWNFKSIGISRENCFRLSEMPYYHDDAIDRLLVATALEQETFLLSDNQEIKKYPVSIIW